MSNPYLDRLITATRKRFKAARNNDPTVPPVDKTGFGDWELSRVTEMCADDAGLNWCRTCYEPVNGNGFMREDGKIVCDQCNQPLSGPNKPDLRKDKP